MTVDELFDTWIDAATKGGRVRWGTSRSRDTSGYRGCVKPVVELELRFLFSLVW